MAHTLTTKKNIRVTSRRTAINKSRKSRIRTFMRITEETIAKNDKDLAKTKFIEFESELMKGVNKGVYKKNTAARKLRKLFLKIKTIQNI